MPHNWTCSEAFLLLRSIFLVEGDGQLELLRGVPDAWITPGTRFGASSLPTALGVFGFIATVGEDLAISIEVTQGQDIPYVVKR